MNLKLSITMPVYNQEALVIRALDSVPRRNDIEMIVCDDGSSDSTWGNLVTYKAQHPELNLILLKNNRNMGIGYSRNRLYDHCKGEYVTSLDSDDYLITDKYNEVIDKYLDGTDIVHVSAKTNAETIYVTEENRLTYGAGTLRLYRRAFMGDTRCDEIRFGEDKTINDRLEAKPHTASYTGIVAYYYNYPRRGSLCDLKSRGQFVDEEGNGCLKGYKNVFWMGNIQPIGGVETFLYSIARKYCDHDITIMYGGGDQEQIKRLSKYVRTVKWNSDPFKCEKMFMNYDISIIDKAEAREYIQVIHTDFKQAKLKPRLHPKIDRVVCVGENVAKSFKELTGMDCEVRYNPLVDSKPGKLLKLISATRLSPEKGADRMNKLADALDAAGVAYQWLVFTNDFEKKVLKNPHFILAKPRLDIMPFIADADYLVQLSNYEGMPYSIREALSVGTGVIVTPMPVIEELGIEDGVHGFVLPFEMEDIPIDRIRKGLKKFECKPLPADWEELLAKGPNMYDPERDGMVTLRVKAAYYDVEIGKNVYPGSTVYTNKDRAKMLKSKGLCE